MIRESDPSDGVWRLSPEDGRVLDAMLDTLRAQPGDAPSGGQPLSHLAQSDAARAERMGRLLNVVAQCPADEPPADLVQSTLDRIQQARQSEMFAQQIQALSTAPSGRFRLNDLLAVAAVMLIGLSLAIPVLSRSQNDARRLACMSNLGQIGGAVSSYEADYGGMLPRRDVQPGTPWFKVGEAQESADAPVRSNSAHYFVLLRNGYLAPQFLACPDNAHAPKQLSAKLLDWPSADAVSYSYTNQHTPHLLTAEQLPDMPILADKNPLFQIGGQGTIELRFNREASRDSVSVFHGTAGQNVLLRNGTVRWIVRPSVPGDEEDNIFLLQGVEQYSGNEVPDDAQDAFLVP